MNTENAPQVEMVGDVPGLLEMSDLLRRVGVETKSFHDQQVAEAAYRAGYHAALNARAGGDAEDAKRYRWLLSQMEVGAVSTQLPLYRSPYLIVYEPCSHKSEIEAAIDAALASQAVGVGK